MFVITQAASALILAATPISTSTQQILDATDGCFDAAFVGRVTETRDFLDLNDILPARPDHLYLGGITSALVRKEFQLVGSSPRVGWVRVILDTVPLPTTKVLLLTKARASDVPTVVYLHTLPSDAGRADFEHALKDAAAERCP